MKEKKSNQKFLITIKTIIVAILIVLSLWNIFCIYNCYSIIHNYHTPSIFGNYVKGGLSHTFYNKPAILLTIGQIINIIILLVVGFYNKNKILSILLLFIVVTIIIITFFVPIYGILPIEPNYNLYKINISN